MLKKLIKQNTIHAISYGLSVSEYFNELYENVLYVPSEKVLYINGIMFSLVELEVYGLDESFPCDYIFYSLRFKNVSKQAQYDKESEIRTFKESTKEKYIGKEFRYNSKYGGLSDWTAVVYDLVFSEDSVDKTSVSVQIKDSIYSYRLIDIILVDTTTTNQKIEKIGARVRLKKDYEAYEMTYKKHHEFTITRHDDMRGWSVIDDNGNGLGELSMIWNEYFELV